jgi:hypothetical protein
VAPFTKEELNAWALVQDLRSSTLEEMGTHYLLVLVPNKETLYSEAMPSYATRAEGPSRLTQLVNELRLHPHLHVLDLRDALLAHKAKARLYHYTDTHWNDTGAFIAYQAIIQALKPWFPTLTPLRYEDMHKRNVLSTGGDLARICGLQEDLKEPQTLLEVPPGHASATLKDGSPLKWSRTDVEGDIRFETRSPTGEIPSVILARDSFADLLIPYLSQHFEQALWLWTYDFPDREVSAHPPKLVIQELAERKLMVLQPN